MQLLHCQKYQDQKLARLERPFLEVPSAVIQSLRSFSKFHTTLDLRLGVQSRVVDQVEELFEREEVEILILVVVIRMLQHLALLHVFFVIHLQSRNGELEMSPPVR